MRLSHSYNAVRIVPTQDAQPFDVGETPTNGGSWKERIANKFCQTARRTKRPKT